MLCSQINNNIIKILPETKEPLVLLDENIISLMSLVLRQCSERQRLQDAFWASLWCDDCDGLSKWILRVSIVSQCTNKSPFSSLKKYFIGIKENTLIVNVYGMKQKAWKNKLPSYIANKENIISIKSCSKVFSLSSNDF